MPAAAVGLVSTAYSAYAANKKAKEAKALASQQEGDLSAGIGLSAEDRAYAKEQSAPADARLLALYKQDPNNPMFFNSDMARFKQGFAGSQRQLSANLQRAGLAGTGAGAAAMAGQGYRGATAQADIFDQNKRAELGFLSGQSDKWNGRRSQATSGQALALSRRAGFYGTQSENASEMSNQGYKDAASSLSGSIGAFSKWYDAKSQPVDYEDTTGNPSQGMDSLPNGGRNIELPPEPGQQQVHWSNLPYPGDSSGIDSNPFGDAGNIATGNRMNPFGGRQGFVGFGT